MKTIQFFLIISLFVGLSAYSQTITPGKYDTQWKQIDSLERKGLPKSAMEIVESIYSKALTDKQHGEYVKALMYKMKYHNNIEDGGFANVIYELKKELETAEFPNNAIMHSLLADLYFMYYQNNRWKFYQRSETVGFETDDIETWSLNKLFDVTIKHYLLSIEKASELQQINKSIYTEIITKGTHKDEIRPTLYDLLAHKALDFFKRSESSLNRPADRFELTGTEYLKDAISFSKLNFQTKDTLSLQFYAILIFRDLLEFRIRENNKDALVDLDLERMDFIRNNSKYEFADSLFLNALLEMNTYYSGSPACGLVLCKIAEHYENMARKYAPLNPILTKYKDFNKKARDLAGQIIIDYPESLAAEKSLALKYRIENGSLNCEMPEAIVPNETFATKINYKNIKKLYVRVCAIDYNKYLKLGEKYYSNELYSKILKESTVFKQNIINLPEDDDYNTHSVEYLIDPLPQGFYVIVISNNEDFSYLENTSAYVPVFSTQLCGVTRTSRDGYLEGNILDRKTGRPLENVKVQTWYYKYDYSARKSIRRKGNTVVTNSDGYFNIPVTDNSNSVYLDYSLNSDFYSNGSSYYLYNYNRYPEKQTSYYTHLFTDRAIYRPGQTIHYKGIVIKKSGKEKEIAADYKATVQLLDVNYQKIAEIELTTNEYGTYSGSFDIPLGLLNGYMQIKTLTGSTSISVEEYKRPKFETKLLPIKGSYILEDEVLVKGSAKSYAGSVLSEAKVNYRIVRTPVWRGWWSWYYNSPETEIAHGEVITNEQGVYEIRFQSIPDKSVPKKQGVTFRYHIYVDVTDINGETQSTQGSVTVGYEAMELSANISGSINRDKDGKFKITTENLNGEFIKAEGEIAVYKLIQPEIALKEKTWGLSDKSLYSQAEWYEKYPGNVYNDENGIRKMQKDKKVFSTSFDSEKSIEYNLDNLKNWETGNYKIEMNSIDSFGNKITYEDYFLVFSEKSMEMPYPTAFWFESLRVKGEPGETAKFLIGSSNNVKVLFEIEHQNKIIEKKWLEINNIQQLVEIPIIEEYRGNFAVHFSYVYSNKLYASSKIITVPYTNKELDIEFMTFRDKLQPGEKEEWKIKIRGKNGEKLAAEMMATLYDASLDQFRANYFNFNILDYYYSSSGRLSKDFGNGYSRNVNQNYLKYHYVKIPYHDNINWHGFNYYGYYDAFTDNDNGDNGAVYLNGNSHATTRNGNNRNKRSDMPDAECEEKTVDQKPASYPTSTSNELTSDTPGLIPSDKLLGSQNEQPVQIRTNFNETAFFYPHLETNKDGDLIVNFTIPESLTRWKMLGLAHTKDLKFGNISEELVTQKELMLLPNIPRFFRENDKIELPVKISNLNDKDLQGVATLEFFDAITGKPVTNIFQDKELKKDFVIKAGQNTLVSWKLEIPEGLGAVEYKIIAKAGKFSDGEQNAVPVLTNRMLVTESMPLPIRGNQTKEFKFEKLINSSNSKTLRHEKVTLEFTSNPAWYAVQALPYLIEYPYECAEQVFSRYYANSLASHVANSSPKIKKVFDSWKNTPDSKALLSNLEKNQELKALLLEETPWVLNAQSESDRKKRIGLLFDLNKMASELQSAVNKLSKMQVSNGGWPWFKGMPESRYITQHVVCGFGHLDVLGVKQVREDNKVWSMVKKAIDYIDERIKEDYDYLKKHYSEKEMLDKMIGYTQIHYLYTRSYFLDQPIPKKIQEAYDYYMSQAQRYWLSESLYMQGMIGLALYRMKDEKTPADIIKSLREHANHSEEMGMYWKDNVGYYWYQAPIERQALLIELFDEVAKDEKAVDDMKVWLLKQKQTQDWKTTKATVEAVYALLLRGADWLESDQLVEIQLGDKIIDPKKLDGVQVEAGTGYFKTSWGKGEITPEMGNIKITKKDAGVAWGALYWQYFEQLDKITPAETPLKLEKKLFIEKMTDRGKVIEPITKNELKVGDKIIVRIELRVDRAMEYVHMKDMRASGFEPINVISRYKYQDGLGYYESTKDAATNFFISYLPKGTYVFEYPLRVTHKGDFSNGITSIQCMYAPEFSSHSEGIRVKVK